MIDSEQKISIRTEERDSRREGLINFVEEFITLLAQEGYSFQDLLEALFCWACTKNNLQSPISNLQSSLTKPTLGCSFSDLRLT